MGRPVEAERRPYITIGKHIHYDNRLDQYGLRNQVIQVVDDIRRETGVGHIEAVPHQWEQDLNFSSITLRGKTTDAEVNLVYKFVHAEGSRDIKLQAETPESPR